MWLMVCLSACNRASVGVGNPLLVQAERQLWQEPQDAERILQLVDTAELAWDDKCCYQVLTCFVQHRLNRPIRVDDLSVSLLQDLRTAGNKYYLAYTYYLRGRAYMASEQLPEAMESLKQAEMYLDALPEDNPCRGLIYYCMGCVLEKELLNASAAAFYQRAEECFSLADRPDYLVYCYRDLARTQDRTDEDGDTFRKLYYAMSRDMAERLGDTVQAAVTMLHMEAANPRPDSSVLCSLAVWLTDTAAMPLYADIAAECLLRNGENGRAHRYMALLRQQQGGESHWAQRRYRELCCLEAAMKGDTCAAYRVLSSLYTDEQLRASEDASLRAFTLEHQFDLNAEREANRHLRGEKILVLVIASLVTLVLILTVVILCIRLSRTRLRQQMEQQLQQAKAQAQDREIKNMSKQLQRLLKERVRTSRNLLRSMLVESNNSKSVTTKQLQDMLLIDAKQWQSFEQEFEMAHNGLLATLRDRYPALTDSDLQYIALAYLRLDNSDISLLLQMKERTLWNRRQRIKNHLGAPNMDLDDWIAGLGLGTRPVAAVSTARKSPGGNRIRKNALALLLLAGAGWVLQPVVSAQPSDSSKEGPEPTVEALASDSLNVQQPDTLVAVPDSLPAKEKTDDSRLRVRHPAPVPIHSAPDEQNRSRRAF